MGNYKIALVAGHFLGTAGKRIPKELDPNNTCEWWLNNRVCDKIEQLLKSYTGYELLRLDDTTGKTNISLEKRVKAANDWGATEYYSVHHNAYLGDPWNGGGIVVFAHPNASKTSLEMQKQLYDALIDATGLKGNRATPLGKSNFYELRKSKMPAVLMELGFMDSCIDAPVILTEEFADKCANAIVSVMAKRGNLKKKSNTTTTTKPNNTKTVKATEYAASGPDSSVNATYKVVANGGLNIRNGAVGAPGKNKDVLVTIPNGYKVRCYGYYTEVSGVKWLYVQFAYNNVNYTGFASSKYLKKV